MLSAGKDLLFSLRPSRHIHYSVIFILGYLAYNGMSFDPVNLLQGLLVINFIFASALLINNIYDAEIDGINKKANIINYIKLHKSRYFTIYGILVLLLLYIAFINGIAQFITAAGLCFLSYIYSSPPIRLKKIFIINLLVIGLAATGTVFMAYIWKDAQEAIKTFNYKAAVIMTIILAAAFSVKDVNDAEGDRAGNVMTIMTVFGDKKGRLITAFLAMLSYFIAPYAVNSVNMIYFALPAGILTFISVLYGKKVNETLVFAVLFIFLTVYLFVNPIQ